MSGDLPDRLRALPPELPDVPDRVQRVRQLARHRRRVQIGAVAAGTAIAVVVPVVLTSALAGQHAAIDRRPAQPGPTAEFATACAFSGLTSRPVQPQKLTRTRDEVLAVVPKGDAVSVFPALVTDPTAPKVGLGSGTKARPMWMAYVLSKSSRFNGVGGIARGGPTIGGRIPVNPSGGLACFGEAVPAQALAQVCEVVWQLRGQAGERQVDGATVGLTANQGLFGHGSSVILSV